MCGAFEKHIGEMVSIGHKRPNGTFFFDGRLKAVSATHLFIATAQGEQAILLSEISKIEFKQASAPTASTRRD